MAKKLTNKKLEQLRKNIQEFIEQESTDKEYNEVVVHEFDGLINSVLDGAFNDQIQNLKLENQGVVRNKNVFVNPAKKKAEKYYYIRSKGDSQRGDDFKQR